MSIDLTHPHFGMIPIEYIVADLNQPRKTFDEEALAELSESIKQSGILQPILTRPVAGSHTDVEIVAGERRYRAAKLAGLTEVPAIVREISDAEVAIMQLVENHQRADVAPIEEAEKMRKAMDEYGFSIEDLCEKMGVKRRWAYTRLQLLQLDHLAVAAPLLHQFLVSPRLDDGAPIHHKNPVGVADGAEAVGDDEGGPVAGHRLEAALDRGLRLVVHRARGLVQDQDRRVPDDRPCDRETLALAP